MSQIDVNDVAFERWRWWFPRPDPVRRFEHGATVGMAYRDRTYTLYIDGSLILGAAGEAGECGDAAAILGSEDSAERMRAYVNAQPPGVTLSCKLADLRRWAGEPLSSRLACYGCGEMTGGCESCNDSAEVSDSRVLYGEIVGMLVNRRLLAVALPTLTGSVRVWRSGGRPNYLLCVEGAGWFVRQMAINLGSITVKDLSVFERWVQMPEVTR